MPLDWKEIANRARAFSKDWKHVEREDADAKSFGVRRAPGRQHIFHECIAIKFAAISGFMTSMPPFIGKD